MIVQPDFLDHWKTRLLVDLLDDESAPLYVIRLWAHCQNRKTHVIPNGNPNITKAICKASCHGAEKFHSAMIEAGFIAIKNGELVAHDWNSINSTLVRNWANGKLGGRPRKENPTVTQPEPKDNPQVTQPKPRREEKSRVEKNRVDNRNKNTYSDDFSEWWKVYGVGTKANAFTAWKKQGLNNSDVSLLIAEAKKYKEYCQSADRSLKDGQGWLNGRFWESTWTHEAQGTRSQFQNGCQGSKKVNLDSIACNGVIE